MSSTSKRTLIRGRVLIDGTGADPVDDGAVLIENGKIVEVGTSSTLRSTGAEVIEVGSTTIRDAGAHGYSNIATRDALHSDRN